MQTTKAQVSLPNMCSLTTAFPVHELEEVSDQEPEIWSHRMAAHMHLKDHYPHKANIPCELAQLPYWT